MWDRVTDLAASTMEWAAKLGIIALIADGFQGLFRKTFYARRFRVRTPGASTLDRLLADPVSAYRRLPRSARRVLRASYETHRHFLHVPEEHPLIPTLNILVARGFLLAPRASVGMDRERSTGLAYEVRDGIVKPILAWEKEHPLSTADELEWARIWAELEKHSA